MLLEAGGSAHDVKSSMQEVATHLGIDRQETAMSFNSLITTSYVGHHIRTEVLEVPGIGVNAALSQK